MSDASRLSAPPGTRQTKAKAYVAAIGAAVLPLLFANLSGASGSFSTIWDSFACWLWGAGPDLVCPTTGMISAAWKAILSAVAGGVLTGFWTWWQQNRPLPPATSNRGKG